MASDRSERFQPTMETLCALLLGRIQIGLVRGNAGALRILAARLVRESLMAALRQEGHEFTEGRFFAWFAGLDTLSAGSEAILRPPKALCQAILTEFQHSPWPDLANASDHLLKAFLAPSDYSRGDDHEAAHTLVAEALALLNGLEAAEDALPFQPVARLLSAAARSTRFAREERNLDLIGGRAVERERRGNSRWALDILAGRYLAPRHGLPLALPFPGLVVLPLGQTDEIEEELAISGASVPTTLHAVLARIDRWLEEAEHDAETIRRQLEDRRSSGRAGRLAEYLAGFGQLRGYQIECLLGVSRTGVGVISKALESSGLIVSQLSRNANRMYGYAPLPSAPKVDGAAGTAFAVSAEAMNEYEDSMRAIDKLLDRFSAKRD